MKGPITAEWLAEIGFRWSQFDRQPERHWTLWLGWAMEDPVDLEDIGIEVAPGFDGKWHCWLRSDMAGRYSRFVHVRYLRWQDDLIELVSAIAGRPFDPADVFHGQFLSRERADRRRREGERLDQRLNRQEPWPDDLADDPTMGGAQAQHLVAYERRRRARRALGAFE